MRLPRLLLLTDRRQLPAGRTLVEHVTRAVDAGVRAVILRERDLQDRERADLASDLAPVLAAVGGQLVVATPELGLPHGVHLRAHDPLPRKHASVVVGRSCHDAEELRQAREEGVDYVVLGPVAPTASKPGYGPALGMEGLERLTRHAKNPPRDASIFPAAPIPRDASIFPAIYALGGVDPDNAADWIAAGADGVAVMGALMRADDPAQVTTDLLAALPTAAVPA